MSELCAVTGATGFIGSAVVRRLLMDGRKVRALVEPGAKVGSLDEVERDLGQRGAVERVTADVTDHLGMVRALEGCATLFHLAAVYKTWMPDPTPMWRVNVEGTTATLLAAGKVGVGRIIYTSSIAAIGVPDDPHADERRGVDESAKWNLHGVANDYVLSKWVSERVALRFAEGGLPVVVVNPAFPFGPRDAAPTPTGAIVLALLKGEVPAIGSGGICCVDVDDVAAAHVAAETRGRVGERYILGGHNMTLRELFELVCEIGRVKPPTLEVPDPVAAGIALGMELIADFVTKKEPRATYRSIRYAQKFAWFDCTKARTELGLPVTPLRDTLERSVTWFRNMAYLDA